MEWIIKEGKLVATFEFKSQTKLAQFILKIAKQADEINHHPDYYVSKAFTLEITLFTHDKKTITESDYTMSKYISTIFQTL